MYVLCCPCVLNPALRARGITRPSDLDLFRLARERCEKFGIEMVPLPCPETLYLGPNREPGTYLERLNTPEFAGLLNELTEKVNALIRSRGEPLCIIGVNSSPTCGVTSTYFGAEGDKPSKRAGRGVFLSRFSTTRAIEIGDFACYRIYLAAPLFSEAERLYNLSIATALGKHSFNVHIPQDIGDSSAQRDQGGNTSIFEENLCALQGSDIVVAIIDGADADSGTAWEMGYAKALGKRVIALRTDFRHVGRHEHVNLMLEQSSTVVSSRDELMQVLARFSTNMSSEKTIISVPGE
jgi:nucleoside 2-deoxyribosyltransferase/predicted secreted protein